MTIKIDRIYQATYLNLLSSTIKQLGIPQTINKMVPYDNQCLTTPGDVVHLILLDIFSGRQAFVHLEGWAHQIDLEKLLSQGVQASFFNDDAIARHLDRIQEENVHQIYSQIAIQAFQKEKISALLAFHGDTTSKSVYGQYQTEKEDIQEDNPYNLLITEGYSRDRQGDKQFQYGAVVNEDGIPIYADVHDGNTSDKTWNPSTLQKVQAQLEKIGVSEFIYVADSAAMTQDTLAQAKEAGAFLITRAPNGLKIVKEALKTAENQPSAWSTPFTTAKSKNGATYQVQEQSSLYYGHEVRLVVVESSALDQKKRHTLEKKKEKEQTKLKAEQARFEKQSYHCEADAQEALEKWVKKQKWLYHDVQPIVEERRSLARRRGRPKKGEIPQETVVFHIKIVATFDDQAYEKACRRASRFVLATTVPPEYKGQLMDSEEVLRFYKGQTNVEMSFSFLKDPYFVDEIYLKKPERVQVLAYLFLLALLVYKVFQRKIRQHVTEKNPLQGAGKRKLVSPTGQAIFQMFQYVQVVVLVLPNGEKQRQFGHPLTYEQRKVLSYLELDETVYL